MDSRIGLDYIVENKEYTTKLAAALDTTNVTIKKQVFELLSALCVYNADGYNRALDALDHYKVLKAERYRFKVVVEELRSASTVEYKTALVAFINCIVISTPQLKDRIRIRNEFIGLKVLDVISRLRQDAVNDSDLAVQLDVFDEQRESDESQISGPDGVDLSSHIDVFYAILGQVAETPQEIPFLSVLQHLLRIDPKEAVSDLIWDTAEKLLHRATLLENKEDSAKLLRAPSHKSLTKLKTAGEGRCLCSCHRDESKSRKHSLNLNLHSGLGHDSLRSPTGVLSPGAVPVLPGGGMPGPSPPPPGGGPPPPPPPLPPGGGPPPPPPPPPPPRPGGGPPPPPPPPPIPGGGPPPPPPPPGIGPPKPPGPPGPPPPPEVEKIKLPQMETPKPRSKMKTINWNKIPNSKVVGKNNIWYLLAKQHEHSPMADMDWEEMEGLFCQQTSNSPSPRQGSTSGTKDEGDRKKKEPTEINLLDGKRSLNVNIFLRQFRVPNEEIMEMIRNGEHSDIGAEKLRGLLKILPESDEMEMLRSFDGDKSKLANAEKFLLMLMEVSQYKLRIEAMLLKEEFEAIMDQLEPSINAVIYAARDLTSNPHLQDVLYMVLVAGNFLNSGGYAGNAAGVKLSSLQKLTDIRANKPGMNLIHYVVQQAERKNADLLKFPEEMSCLEEAHKTSMDQIVNEMKQLDQRIKRLSDQLSNSKTPNEIRLQMGNFLKMASSGLTSLKDGVAEVEKVKKEVAEFFCEDPGVFKLEECFKVFNNFCNRFKQAIAENERRRQQEEQAEIRRRMREENAVKRRSSSQGGGGGGQPRPGSYSGSESEVNIMDHLLSDIRSGFTQRKYAEMALNKGKKGKKYDSWQNGGMTSEDETSNCNSPRLTRRRMGSFSGPSGPQGDLPVPNDNSPDVTPNGTIRRRRSRVPSEEDDHKLMDFLQTAGHDASRERKSWTGLGGEGYGSLDRAFTRRVRGGGRNRPSLLASPSAAESDRERPASPSPAHVSAAKSSINMENKPEPPDQNRPSGNWRQKIESWFKENEKEERRSEELKRRLQQHRKSLDLDTVNLDESSVGGGVAPSLGTLPEDMPSEDTTSAGGYKRVYQDWKPSVDKTDVVGAMEAIEEAQSPLPSREKDKSPWRKSNLNVANSCEATSELQPPSTHTSKSLTATSGSTSSSTPGARRLRRLRSRSNIEPGQVIHATQTLAEAVAADRDEDCDEEENSRRSSLIQTLGRQESSDTLRLYIRRPSEDVQTAKDSAASLEGGELCNDSANLSVPSMDIHSGGLSPTSLRRGSAPVLSTSPTSPSASRRRSDSDDLTVSPSRNILLNNYRNANISPDVLAAIEEAQKHSDSEPAKRREKKAYQRTMTPNSLRSALHEKLKSNLDATELAGTIRSLGDGLVEEEEEEDRKSSETGQNDDEKVDEQKILPPHIPKHLRQTSGDEDKLDKIEIDAENIETPPVTRRAYGIRSFRSPIGSSWASGGDDGDEFLGRRTARRFRSLTGEDRRTIIGEKYVSENDEKKNPSKQGPDSSENEGNASEVDERVLTTRRSMRFKELADLAKECDSETEQMLARQKQQKPIENDEEELGDGNFNRFSSVRKTLRHKKTQDKSDGARSSSETRTGDRTVEVTRPSAEYEHEPRRSRRETLKTVSQQAKAATIGSNRYEDKDTRLKRWQKIKESKSGDEGGKPKRTHAGDSWKERITRRFRSNIDKYDVQKATEEHKRKILKDEREMPATERVKRKNQDAVGRNSETRGSFRSTLPASDALKNRRIRTRSAIDPAQVRSALDKEKERQTARKMAVGDSGRGVGNLFSKLDTKSGTELSSLRRNEARNRPFTDDVRPPRHRGKILTKTSSGGSKEQDRDEGFEDTVSLKSDSTSQGALSTGGTGCDVPDAVTSNPSRRRTEERNSLRIDNLMGGLRGSRSSDGDSSTGRSTLGNSRKSDNSSHNSLRSSHSSLASATSVNTVRHIKSSPSKSPSQTSIVSNRSDASARSKGKMADYTNAFKSLTKSLRIKSGRAEEHDSPQSVPTSPNVDVEQQPTFPAEKTRSSLSLQSSGGNTPTRSLSRNESLRSTGSLSKQSSDGSLKSRRNGRNNTVPTKRPLAPSQLAQRTTSSSNDGRGRTRSLSSSTSSLRRSPGSTPNSSVKVKRGDSGSSKENLSRSNSATGKSNSNRNIVSRTSSSSSSKAPLSSRPVGRSSSSKSDGAPTRARGTSASPAKGGGLPAFMRPTTASASKRGGPEPVRKIKVVSKSISPQKSIVK